MVNVSPLGVSIFNGNGNKSACETFVCIRVGLSHSKKGCSNNFQNIFLKNHVENSRLVPDNFFLKKALLCSLVSIYLDDRQFGIQ